MMRRRLTGERGFTLVELVAALALLTVGILAVAATFDFSRASTDQSELQTAAVDRAQREIEAIRSLPYEQVAHPTGGILTASSDPQDPTSRIAGTSFRWNRASASASEPLVTADDGAVPMRQIVARAADDRFGYTIWRFVTRTAEPACASAVDCDDGGGNYRRVTVVVRANGLGDTLDPVWTSTTVIDPAAAANNDGQPQTLCQKSDGSGLELCSGAVEDVPLTLHLTNTSAHPSSVRQAIPADPAQRKLHKTVRVPATCTATASTGCPIPDLMVEDPLPTLEPADVPAPVSFATDVTPAVAAGRPLKKEESVGCNGTPSRNDDLRGAYWVSPPLSTATTLTGRGEMRLYSRTWTEAAHWVTLCGVVYNVPSTITNPVPAANAPVEIGRFNVTREWPAAFQPVAFDVDLQPSHGYEVAANRRIGVRLWLAPASGDDVVLLYDHHDHQSSLTLLTEEEHP